jgi:hypothetical protein
MFFPNIPMADFFIPFIFVLAVVYGALEIAGIFKNKAVNTVIAIVFAFFAASTPFVSSFIYAVFPYAVLIFIAIFFLAFLKRAFLGKGKAGEGKKDHDWTLIIILCVLALLLMASFTDAIDSVIGPMGIGGESVIYMIAFVVIIAIFFMAYKMTKGPASAQ